MVERERDEGESWQEEGAAEDESDEKAGNEREEDDHGGDQGVEWSEIQLAVEELSPPAARPRHGGGGDVKAAASSPPTLRFLALSHLLLRVLDKMGPTMAVLRLDVQHSNGTSRLQELYLLDPAKFTTLTGVVEKEVKEGTARKVDSCARAVLWLARSMDFTIALLQSLEEDPEQQRSLAELVEATYVACLKPWHGWISSAACKIALKLIPERKVFTSLLLGMGQDSSALNDEIRRLTLLIRSLLDDIHYMMAKFRLDRLKST